MKRRPDREGMALLTVLLLVAVMSVVAVALLDDVRFSVRRATNAETGGQAQWLASGAELMARDRIRRLMLMDPTRTPLEPDWNGRRLDFPIDNGAISATVSDGQACFNLNSVVLGVGEDLIARPEGAAQFRALGRAVGVPDSRMRAITDALTDWLDADNVALPLGAEDGAYAGLSTPYRTAGVMMAETSELRAVKGVDEDAYRRLRPYVCALPTSQLSPLNVNTLSADQAPLISMLTLGQVTPQQARAVIARRPRDGWANSEAFWSQPALSNFTPDEGTRAQAVVLTRFFRLRVDVEYGGARAVRTALLEARPDGAVRTVIQRWTPEE
ncbi:type II secretion system minor pseudopilin GspK [Brevundimonas sp. M20]|uniref:type II secretion system minor pseudopilin GspK n=1 Tax=Brevundimonas sp. M20 TaxID=2591463 RepID=UPI00114661BB|nr:type II secretion system minor pseudopilin GspK [Brevundimonas sp. M20]QDH73231.1 general secretion pathway protein GspK [Brevundimonas sp. M20]